MKEDALLCVGQKAVIEKDGKILLLVDAVTGVDLPGGKIQVGELDFKKALEREVLEETNFQVKILYPFYVWFYAFPNNIEHRNKGKECYVIAFRCKYVSGDFVMSDEHVEFRWVGKNDYKEYVKGSDYEPVLKKYFSAATIF